MNTFEFIRRKFTTKSAMARAFGVSHNAVFIWEQKGYLPERQFVNVPEATAGKVTVDEMWELHKAQKGE